MRNVVLIHGAWHGSWCWSLVTGHLAALGVPSVAVDLDGHGLNSVSPESRWSRPFDPAAFATEPSGSASVTLTSAATTLIEQIRRIGQGDPCVVVAHSMGGAVATAAAEREPSLFAHLVYLTAFAPVAGLPAGAYIETAEADGEKVRPLIAADPFATGTLRVDPGNRQQHAAIRETFYGDVEPALADAAIGLLGTENPLGIGGEAFAVTGARYGSVPHTYVVCAKDNAIPEPLQRRFIREIDDISAAPTAVVELDSSHSPFLSQPDVVAETIATVWSQTFR